MHLNLRVVTPEYMQAFSASKSQQNNVVYFYSHDQRSKFSSIQRVTYMYCSYMLYVNVRTKIAIFPNFNTLFVALMTHGYTCMQ